MPGSSGADTSGPVDRGGDALVLGAVRAAEEPAIRLDAVADDLHAAVLAHRGQRVDRALERVEGVALAVPGDLECLVVLVAAHLTGRHLSPPTARSSWRLFIFERPSMFLSFASSKSWSKVRPPGPWCERSPPRRPEEMSFVEVLEAVRDSPARARSLFTVRAAISSAVSSERPRFSSPSLMCSYWRSLLLPFLTPRGGIFASSGSVVSSPPAFPASPTAKLRLPGIVRFRLSAGRR